VEQLRDKLYRRGYDRRQVDAVVDDLQRDHLVSDRRFTETCLRSLAERGYGPLRVAAELRQFHVDESLVGELLDIDDPRWNARASLARRKRFRNGIPRDYKSRARQARFLQYRGFTNEQIQHALENAEEQEILDEED